MSQLPAPIRAALGLVATVIHDRGELSDKVVELPVLAVSTALQISLRAQQRYAELTVRGDELLSQLRGGAPVDPPAWARFDEDAPDVDATEEVADASPPAATPPPAVRRTRAPSPAKAAEAAEAMAKVAEAAEAAHAAEPTAPAAKTAAPAKRAAKTVTTPRNGKTSAFDRIADSDTGSDIGSDDPGSGAGLDASAADRPDSP